MGETSAAPSGGEKRGTKLRVLGVKSIIGKQTTKTAGSFQYRSERKTWEEITVGIRPKIPNLKKM
jgi:hypothetical protein